MRNIRFVHSLLFALVLFAPITLTTPVSSFAQIGVSITIAPPMLPVYAQPVIPSPGYIWTPGYWAWDPDYGDYYWVPGTWVQAPETGFLWTPGYWGWAGGAFLWNAGYWGPHIGFYGGVNYGFGYVGVGYEGGYWNNGAFFYNRSVNNVTNVTNITNVYNKTVVNNVTVNNVSYNGGQGGITAQPTAAERTAASERHIPPIAAQTQQEHAASANPSLRASVNHGKPPIAATAKPGVFSGAGVVAAKAAAPYHAPAPAAKGPATAKGTTARSPNPGGGGTHPMITAHPAQPGSAPHPATAQPRTAPHPATVQPRTAAPHPATTQPRTAPHPAAAQPRTASHPATAQPRTASHPATAQPRTASRPPAAPHAAPAPKSAPHPSAEKPKKEQKPPS